MPASTFAADTGAVKARAGDRGPWRGLAGIDLRALTPRTDRHAVVRVCVHVLLLAASAALIHVAAGSAWRWPAMFAHGVLLVALFAAAHECIHYTAFRSRWLNHLVAFVAGLVLLLPSRWFHWFHLAHHRLTQQPGDPELASPKPESLASWLWWVSGVPYWHSQVRTLAALAAGRVHGGFVPRARHAGVVAEARLLLGLYALVAAGAWWLGSRVPLDYWLWPVLLAQPLLRLFLLAEHGGCPRVPDMLDNTRTTLTSGAVRWLAWNMPYHTEHHLAPAVPFHALPALHRLIAPRLRHCQQGYLRFHLELLRGLFRRIA